MIYRWSLNFFTESRIITTWTETGLIPKHTFLHGLEIVFCSCNFIEIECMVRVTNQSLHVCSIKVNFGSFPRLCGRSSVAESGAFFEGGDHSQSDGGGRPRKIQSLCKN